MPRRLSVLTAVTLALLLLGAMPAEASPRLPRWAARATTHAAPPAKAPTERAFSISRKDGNDVKGPLDLAAFKISRGKTKDTVAFTGQGPISNSALDINDGNLLILIDVDDAPPFEYGQYLFYASGKLRGVLVNLATNNIVDRTVPTSRTGSRGFRQVIQRGKIHSSGTYRFIAGSYYQGSPCSEAHACIDTLPNRYPPLIPLDHRAPSFHWNDSATYSGDVSDDLTSPVSFDVSDDQHGTGIKSWTLQKRDLGGGRTWTTVQTGRGLSPDINMPGDEGATHQFRVVVIDRQKNRTMSAIRRTTFPFDDDAATYDPLVVQDVAATGWFLGTRSGISNAVVPGTATFTFTGGTGTQVCVMGGPVAAGTATADVALDGVPQLPMTEDVSVLMHSRIQCYTANNLVPHTLLVTATGASTFWIDGFYVVPT